MIVLHKHLHARTKERIQGQPVPDGPMEEDHRGRANESKRDDETEGERDHTTKNNRGKAREGGRTYKGPFRQVDRQAGQHLD